MRVVMRHERCLILHGDAAELGQVVEDNSVDAICTDPPAGIGFMAKSWDTNHGGRDAWVTWLIGLLRPALQVLKPGGYALLWALPRTSHWTALALENAGFEIRDVHHHIFGTGFPKSLDINKGVAAHLGIPDTNRAAWQGFGTALKPAVEHWILARKPLMGTYAQNVLAHGTGGLNIDACRIGTHRDNDGKSCKYHRAGNRCEGHDARGSQENITTHGEPPKNQGRWPAHLSLEHAEACQEKACVIGCPVRALDEQSGPRPSGARGAVVQGRRRQPRTYSVMAGKEGTSVAASSGGASRFFYCAKPSRKERDAGLGHLPAKGGGEATGREEGSVGTANPRAGAGRTGGARNFHPTVKSTELMRWLVRLITPPGGVVLDLFAGTGTTGIAALAEGCRFVGVELGGDNDEYIPLLEGRLRHALEVTP